MFVGLPSGMQWQQFREAEDCTICVTSTYDIESLMATVHRHAFVQEYSKDSRFAGVSWLTFVNPTIMYHCVAALTVNGHPNTVQTARRRPLVLRPGNPDVWPYCLLVLSQNTKLGCVETIRKVLAVCPNNAGSTFHISQYRAAQSIDIVISSENVPVLYQLGQFMKQMVHCGVVLQLQDTVIDMPAVPDYINPNWSYNTHHLLKYTIPKCTSQMDYVASAGLPYPDVSSTGIQCKQLVLVVLRDTEKAQNIQKLWGKCNAVQTYKFGITFLFYGNRDAQMEIWQWVHEHGINVQTDLQVITASMLMTVTQDQDKRFHILPMQFTHWATVDVELSHNRCAQQVISAVECYSKGQVEMINGTKYCLIIFDAKLVREVVSMLSYVHGCTFKVTVAETKTEMQITDQIMLAKSQVIRMWKPFFSNRFVWQNNGVLYVDTPAHVPVKLLYGLNKKQVFQIRQLVSDMILDQASQQHQVCIVSVHNEREEEEFVRYAPRVPIVRQLTYGQVRHLLSSS